MYAIQNRQKRTWIVPGITTPDNSAVVHEAVFIEPGETAFVKPEHWDAIKNGNQVIEALLTGRHLVVSESGALGAVDLESLANPAQPVAPTELTEVSDDVTFTEKKTEVKEVTLDDGPKEGKSRKG